MNYIAYIVTALSIIGTVANSYQKRWCFFIWLFTNSFWCTYNLTNGMRAQALLYLFNGVTCIIGLCKWRKRKRE